ncbi:xenotropic and polytropic retrovirus receptor 1 [Eurytemora carolleeae]|uniref:xenotropic and polytropic retrovirus receptor 1 n=1 Tax=Eurytemora carolleeae TaxID=1294199 RepID=UPI000C7629E2|nr:xenotropic and polytropic retrovirus receptor 1 [Eurytemora carolleeae]|eukprot:XP_023340360.1 xenotropic and polytropic retrovirus receptor 1-like [Eurytemora affinis]
MKFTEHLGAHITPEWRKQYIQYEEMKAMLYACVEQAPSEEVVEEEVSQRYFARFDEKFFTYCTKELTKINTFYAEKLAEATRKFATLKTEMDGPDHDDLTQKGHKKIQRRKVMDLKLAFSEFYLSLILLQNYQNLNFTGFRKILKKHDKLLRNDAGARWREENVESSHFHTNKDIDKLIADTESTVTSDLEGGDRQKAMKRLRVPPLGDKQSPWTTFKVGLFAGAFVVLLIAVILSAVFHGAKDSKFSATEFDVALRLYRGPLLYIIFVFLMGINVYGWRSSGVNHVLIFELDPRNHLSEQHLFELATIFGVVWTVSILSFLYAEHLDIQPFIMPGFLVLIMLIFLLNPTRTFQHDARFWSLKVIFRIIMAPFFYVGFADFWLADQANSLGQALKDFQFLVCFYVRRFSEWDWEKIELDECGSSGWWLVGVVGALPAWFRFAQCLRRYRDTREAFPHLLNAGKYTSSLSVVLFTTLYGYYETGESKGPFFYLMIISSVVSTVYGYLWDIKMDWGFFSDNAGDNRFLREEVVYSSTNYYYFAILEDLVLRFSWVYILLIKESGLNSIISSEIVTTVFACLEVVRRFIWNFFRLENEHLNNCGKFRAVRDISVAPLDASDQQQIINMMDDPDPRNLFRKKKIIKMGIMSTVESLKVPLLKDTDDEPLTMASNYKNMHSVGAIL